MSTFEEYPSFDPDALYRVTFDSADQYPDDVRQWVYEQLQAGRVVVHDPPGSEWVTICVGHHSTPLARVHRSRLIPAKGAPGSN